MIKAWHCTGSTLRDGSPIPEIGQVLRHEGDIEMCRSGLHASLRIIDALCYAPGHYIHRVACDVDVEEQDDKLVCRERTILWSVNGETLLREFARKCALDVIHLWNAPDVVRRFLETGDECLRASAWDAAWDAARDAAWASAWAAARASAWDAAWDAARASAWAAARASAWNAAGSAAWNAAGSAAWNAAGDAERDAARDAAWAAARDDQNTRLEKMVRKEASRD